MRPALRAAACGWLILLSLPLLAADADRWEAEIARFEAQDRQSPPAPGGILFLGSSSIRLWDVERSFPGLPVANRGFGGSQIADSVRYLERIAAPRQPRVVVFYAGDNDIASGKAPQQVAADFHALVEKLHAALPETRLVYIAIKPSIRRWALVDKVREANRLIRAQIEKDPLLAYVDTDAPMIGADGKPRAELLRDDGLHLTDRGYELWTKLVRPHLEK